MSEKDDQLIRRLLDDGARLRRRCADLITVPLQRAGACMAEHLRRGGKILACGNGGSAADAQHFAGELVNRFEMDRPGLAALALTPDPSVMTSIANDISFEQVYARQVEALGRTEDVLLAISTSGDSANVIAAADTAGRKGMDVIALTGADGGALGVHGAVTVHINIPAASTPRVQEMHIACLHILCALIERTLFGEHA